MSVIVEWVRRSGVSSSKEVDFRSSCEAIPKEALIPNMRRIRANATRSRVLMWKNTFSTIIQKWFNSSSTKSPALTNIGIGSPGPGGGNAG